LTIAFSISHRDPGSAGPYPAAGTDSRFSVILQKYNQLFCISHFSALIFLPFVSVLTGLFCMMSFSQSRLVINCELQDTSRESLRKAKGVIFGKLASVTFCRTTVHELNIDRSIPIVDRSILMTSPISSSCSRLSSSIIKTSTTNWSSPTIHLSSEGLARAGSVGEKDFVLFVGFSEFWCFCLSHLTILNLFAFHFLLTLILMV
jgi:hypothetical protein